MTFKTLTTEQIQYLKRFTGKDKASISPGNQYLQLYDSLIKAMNADERLTKDQVNYLYDRLRLKQMRSVFDEDYVLRDTIMVELLNDYTDELFYTI